MSGMKKRENGKRLGNRRLFSMGLFGASVLFLLLVAVFGYVWQDAASVTDFSRKNLPPCAGYLFGTDWMGRDMLKRTVAGLSLSIRLGLLTAAISAAVALALALLASLGGGLMDSLVCGLINLVMGIPHMLLLILISYIMQPGMLTMIISMCVVGWLGMARFIRNQIVIIRDRDYNLASRCLGTSTLRIITRNLLPYLVSVITLRMALAIPGAIGSEVFITYIGLGLPVSTPSLGNLINTGRKLISTSQSYQLVFPTIVLSIITISFYLIGNAFADAADPKNHV